MQVCHAETVHFPIRHVYFHLSASLAVQLVSQVRFYCPTASERVNLRYHLPSTASYPPQPQNQATIAAQRRTLAQIDPAIATRHRGRPTVPVLPAGHLSSSLSIGQRYKGPSSLPLPMIPLTQNGLRLDIQSLARCIPDWKYLSKPRSLVLRP